MSIVFLIIIGAGAGFVATRLMGVRTNVITTIAIGVVGALVGAFLLRFLLLLIGLAAGFIGALIGAALLIWAYQTYVQK